MNDFFDEDTNDNIVMCDKCNVAVHMTCYGQDLLVKGKPAFPNTEEWYCRRCLVLMSNHRNNNLTVVKPNDISCKYCFDVKGAIV